MINQISKAVTISFIAACVVAVPPAIAGCSYDASGADCDIDAVDSLRVHSEYVYEPIMTATGCDCKISPGITDIILGNKKKFYNKKYDMCLRSLDIIDFNIDDASLYAFRLKSIVKIEIRRDILFCEFFKKGRSCNGSDVYDAIISAIDGTLKFIEDQKLLKNTNKRCVDELYGKILLLHD